MCVCVCAHVFVCVNTMCIRGTCVEVNEFWQTGHHRPEHECWGVCVVCVCTPMLGFVIPMCNAHLWWVAASTERVLPTEGMSDVHQKQHWW